MVTVKKLKYFFMEVSVMDEDKKVNEQEEQKKDNSAINSNVQTEKQETPKKRRSKKEIAEDKLKREKQLNSDAETAKANIAEYKKQMAELQKKIEAEEKKRTSNRNAIRTHKAMKLYGDLIAMLGFDTEEKACATETDFDELAVLVKDKVKVLLHPEKKK